MMTLENPEFDDVRQDLDAEEPLDGRNSQPAEGSSDAPQAMDAEDPLHGVERVLADNDHDPLALNPEPLDEQRIADPIPLDDEAEEDRAGIDAQRLANLPDQRQTPDQQ